MTDYITRVMDQLRAENKPKFQIEYIQKWIDYVGVKAVTYDSLYDHVCHLYGFGLPSAEMVKIFNSWRRGSNDVA